MPKMIAACGIDCSTCEAFLATQANDEDEKERIAVKWRELFHAPGIDAAYVTCDGCLAGERAGGHQAECDIRVCAVGRGLPNCAHCGEFESCAKLEAFLQFVPPARASLQTTRRELRA